MNAPTTVSKILLLVLAATAPAFAQKLTQVYPLKPEEGVFAYARISPAGDFLAYASELSRRTVTVVDLKQQKVVFSEAGIDAYWSNDGKRMIFLSYAHGGGGVSIWHADTGEVARDVAPTGLGDYFSWAVRDNKQLILTIQSNFYYLDGDRSVMPWGKVTSCPGYGTGDRPLISKDGRRITTFVRGNVVVRGLTDCDDIIDTGLQGAKADFSWDGRYIAFHTAKPDKHGYQIAIVDLQKKTMRTIGGDLPGSSLFPSWTQGGRLCYRYDEPGAYRGFMIAENVLDAPEKPLPQAREHSYANLRWPQLFPETPLPDHRVNLVLVWSSWSAHSPEALTNLQAFGQQHKNVGVTTAVEISSLRDDLNRLRNDSAITLPEIPFAPDRVVLTEAMNQMPTTLLFRDGVLVDRKLGAQTAANLQQWVQHWQESGSGTSPGPR